VGAAAQSAFTPLNQHALKAVPAVLAGACMPCFSGVSALPSPPCRLIPHPPAPTPPPLPGRLGQKKQRDRIFGGANLELVKVPQAGCWGRWKLACACCWPRPHPPPLHEPPLTTARDAHVPDHPLRCTLSPLAVPQPKDAQYDFKDIAGIDQVRRTSRSTSSPFPYPAARGSRSLAAGQALDRWLFDSSRKPHPTRLLLTDCHISCGHSPPGQGGDHRDCAVPAGPQPLPLPGGTLPRRRAAGGAARWVLNSRGQGRVART
jgi:hypothetical protein